MNIGVAASESGLSAKMIRYYERIDLISSSRRTQAGYRVYREQDVQVLRFIHHARDLGFSVEQVRTLLALWRDRARSDDEVEAIARGYLEALNARIALLQAMREALSCLADHCDDMGYPVGPLLDDRPPTT
ncbi:MerR family transcriptional regulator [Pseudomonas cavernicola]|uniref:MerR family transcriptional regulator n=1 Tax=Pseudomonas cavernicola TaxID=2320866 RepID=A0A418XP36_9PSED|nr:MerR family DNA-binding protein [Pseudomonas cavernicola]RJG14230.1 MerR family transcriptional regulator [Pseudomonas cavernicola]